MASRDAVGAPSRAGDEWSSPTLESPSEPHTVHPFSVGGQGAVAQKEPENRTLGRTTAKKALGTSRAASTRPSGRVTLGTLFLILGVVVSAIGVGAVLLQPDAATGTDIVFAFVDVSGSCDAPSRCTDVLRLARDARDTATDALHFTLFASGSDTTGGRPQAGEVIEYTRPAGMLEGAAGGAPDQFLSAVEKQCQHLETTTTSPIVAGFAGALGSFPRAACAAPGAHCRLLARTDLDDPVLAAVPRKDADGHVLPILDNRLPNGGVIEVRICGPNAWRQTRGEKVPPSVDVLVDRLRPHFTAPEAVTVTASCAPTTLSR